jgi:hypothetical protein
MGNGGVIVNIDADRIQRAPIEGDLIALQHHAPISLHAQLNPAFRVSKPGPYLLGTGRSSTEIFLGVRIQSPGKAPLRVGCGMAQQYPRQYHHNGSHHHTLIREWSLQKRQEREEGLLHPFALPALLI